MAKLKTQSVELNSIQLALLPIIADLIQQNARSPNKKTVSIYKLDKLLPYTKEAIKTNLYKFKELKKCC